MLKGCFCWGRWKFLQAPGFPRWKHWRTIEGGFSLQGAWPRAKRR